MAEKDHSKHVRVNLKIKAKEVRLIDTDGKQIGMMPIKDALNIASERDLDLVEVAPNSVPPVCKIMDFGKYRYQLNKRHSQRKTIDVKEIKIRPRIDGHDLDLKIKNINRFIEGGDKAKVVMYFRGREIIRPEYGMKIFEKIAKELKGKFQIEQQPKLEGNHIIMVVAPKS